jgi:hypothetical protein
MSAFAGQTMQQQQQQATPFGYGSQSQPVRQSWTGPNQMQQQQMHMQQQQQAPISPPSQTRVAPMPGMQMQMQMGMSADPYGSAPMTLPSRFPGLEAESHLTEGYLRRLNASQFLNVPDDAISALSRLSVLQMDALTRMLMTAQMVPEISARRQLVQTVDSVRDSHAKQAESDMQQNAMGMEPNPDEFIQTYLMPGEQVLASLAYESYSTAYVDVDGKRTGESSISGSGKLFLTSHRVVVATSSSSLSGEYRTLKEYEKTASLGVPVISSLKRRIAALSGGTSAGFLGGLGAAFAMLGIGGGDAHTQQKRRRLQQELDDQMALQPELRKRDRLAYLLNLLEPCCNMVRCAQMCTCPCCREHQPLDRFVVSMHQCEDFDVMPLPLDRFLQAEMSWSVEVSSAGAVDREERCCGLPFCGGSVFHVTPADAIILQEQPAKQILLTFGVIMPPWGRRAELTFRMEGEVTSASVSSFLALFHQLAPSYRIESIVDGGGATSMHPNAATAAVQQMAAKAPNRQTM